MKVGSITYRALVVLVGRGPISADLFGAYVWRGKKRGKVVSSNGGGDYGAQMFLGRLRKRGFAQHHPSEGSSRWEATTAGRQALAKALTKSGAPGEVEHLMRRRNWHVDALEALDEHAHFDPTSPSPVLVPIKVPA